MLALEHRLFLQMADRDEVTANFTAITGADLATAMGILEVLAFRPITRAWAVWGALSRPSQHMAHLEGRS